MGSIFDYHFDRQADRPPYVEVPDYHAVTSIQLCELINDGFLDWSRSDWDWSSYAYDAEQYSRICEQFNSRYYWREIGLSNPGQWKQRLLHRIKFELMPKYKRLYSNLAEGFNPLAEKDEYGKSRDIDSGYPETLLSGNADYASHGKDSEYEKVTVGDYVERLTAFKDGFQDIDTMLLDELDDMFTHLFTNNVNAL